MLELGPRGTFTIKCVTDCDMGAGALCFVKQLPSSSLEDGANAILRKHPPLQEVKIEFALAGLLSAHFV